MVDDDPFGEPDDTEKTVIRPNPGGRRPAVPPSMPQPPTAHQPVPQAAPPHAGAANAAFGIPQHATSAPAQPGGAASDTQSAVTGMNPLHACGATLFSLLGRIRNRAQHPDPDALRRSVVAEIRAFETRALQAGIDAQQLKIAKYAICATLDDVVLNTPWGGASDWAQQSMVATFHREGVAGDRFFDLLARLEQDPGRNIDLLEFLYMCLSLGFEGRLRIEPKGAERHQEIRAGLAGIIRRQRGELEHDLSPHWKGVDRPHRRLSAWTPVWIALAASLTMLTFGFLGLSWTLAERTAPVGEQFAALSSVPTATLARRAPPVAQLEVVDDAELEKVSGFLTEEIDEGLVTVFQDAQTITVRINGAGMFASASDALQPAFEQPLERVAAALNSTTGPVLVVGHADSSPIRTARFPSNLELSLARAESVRKRLATQLDVPDRMQAEGRSDSEPIASNDTREGRALNRRIEIVLVKEDAP
jgi:type VI secretion system protein ImpK